MRLSRSLPLAGLAGVAGVAAHDLLQRRHSLLRNFPVLGHGRYLIETIGPELRQYVVAGNDEERPFTRDQRAWIYTSSKGKNNYFGFGTDNDLERWSAYPIVKHRTFAAVTPPTHAPGDPVHLPAAKILGGSHGRAKAFRPASVVNVSAMSFGSLSAPAIQAINEGVAIAGCLHNTGEGGLSPHHRNGGDLIWQIGTGYFGCRDADGNFDIDRLVETAASAPVKAIEIKLSQGAKPGLGGVLPASKVTEEIAQIRGIPVGKDCISPSRHSAFHDIESMIDFVELIAERTGLPVGIKSAVGNLDFWHDLAAAMVKDRSRGVDFITIDGGEGGTGAAPLMFADHVSLPFRPGFARVYAIFAEAGLTDDIVFIGSGKLGLPENAIVAFALGADMVNIAREAMLSIGCIQTQKCHTDRCPVGVATQNAWLARGLDPQLKKVRLASYVATLRRDLLKVSEACGVLHPGLIGVDDVDLLEGDGTGMSLRERYGYHDDWGLLGPELAQEITELMLHVADQGGSSEQSEPSHSESVAGEKSLRP